VAATRKRTMLYTASSELQPTPGTPSVGHHEDELTDRPPRKMMVVQAMLFIVAILALPLLLPVYLFALFIGLVAVAFKKVMARGTSADTRPTAAS